AVGNIFGKADEFPFHIFFPGQFSYTYPGERNTYLFGTHIISGFLGTLRVEGSNLPPGVEDVEIFLRGTNGIYSWHVGLAREISPELSLGALFQVVSKYQEIIERRERIKSADGGTELLERKKRFFERGLGPGLTLGALYKINPRWQLGLVAKSPVKLYGRSRFELSSLDTEAADQVTESTKSRHYDEVLPPLLGIGLSYRPSENLLFSASANRIFWDIFEVNGREQHFQDISQLHFGMEYGLRGPGGIPLPIRLGFYTDPSPAKGPFKTALAGTLERKTKVKPEGDLIYFTAGTGLRLGRFTLDIAAQYGFGSDKVQNQITGEVRDIRERIFSVILTATYYF
ncbi:MAG: OmpP1/FadL family transporter, partial [Nitrospinota bacterium]